MEPCLFRHGKVLVRINCRSTYFASMEPCLFRHGKGVAWVQAGCPEPELQWSHVFSDMVSGHRGAGGLPGDGRFNGAMSFQTW